MWTAGEQRVWRLLGKDIGSSETERDSPSSAHAARRSKPERNIHRECPSLGWQGSFVRYLHHRAPTASCHSSRFAVSRCDLYPRPLRRTAGEGEDPRPLALGPPRNREIPECLLQNFWVDRLCGSPQLDRGRSASLCRSLHGML